MDKLFYFEEASGKISELNLFTTDSQVLDKIEQMFDKTNSKDFDSVLSVTTKIAESLPLVITHQEGNIEGYIDFSMNLENASIYFSLGNKSKDEWKFDKERFILKFMDSSVVGLGKSSVESNSWDEAMKNFENTNNT